MSPWQAGPVRVVIEGRDLPGAEFCDVDGGVLDSVHVGIQIRRDPCELVRGDADSARWELEVSVVTTDDRDLDFRGPAVQGRRGDRFLYLTWGNVGDDGEFAMFRRAKLMLDRVDPELVRTADSGDRPLVGRVSLTDEHGGPRCARVDPPALEWRLG